MRDVPASGDAARQPAQPSAAPPDSAESPWHDLTTTLINALAQVRAQVQAAAQPPSDDVERAQAARATLQMVRAGAGVAVRMEHDLPHELAGSGAAPTDHPLVRLARAYRAAFDGISAACLGLHDAPDAVVVVAPQFLDLAQRAAAVLSRIVDLIFRGRGLGTVTYQCDYIGALEDQADTLFRQVSARSAPGARAARLAAGWDVTTAATISAFESLEALTDRCEDIAEALLLVYRTVAQPGAPDPSETAREGDDA